METCREFLNDVPLVGGWMQNSVQGQGEDKYLRSLERSLNIIEIPYVRNTSCNSVREYMYGKLYGIPYAS